MTDLLMSNTDNASESRHVSSRHLVAGSRELSGFHQ
jgi:hypothetical protein